MGTLMAYGPDVVGLPGGPMRGMYELWENPNPSASLAEGEVVTIKSDYTFDTFLIEVRYIASVNQTILGVCEADSGRAQIAYTFIDSSTGKIGNRIRIFTITQIGDTISVICTRGLLTILNTYGSSSGISDSTDNNTMIPVRIWGIMKE